MFAISGICAVGCHVLPPRSPGSTGSQSERPRLVLTWIWTFSVETRPSSALLRLANRRRVGSARPRQVKGVTAALPWGSESDRLWPLPPTL